MSEKPNATAVYNCKKCKIILLINPAWFDDFFHKFSTFIVVKESFNHEGCKDFEIELNFKHGWHGIKGDLV